MFSSFKSMVRSGKDSAISSAVKTFINMKVQSHGVDVQEFTIDSKDKNIMATIIFEEEKEPLTIKALEYTITTKNEKHFLEVTEIQKSREWNNNYIDGKRYKIPPQVLKIVEFIL